jgi:hypothetical protein
MSPELQAMQDAIKAIGDAVADLTLVCEGLPKFLEKRLSSFQADMTSKLDAAQHRMDESAAKATDTVLELRASLAAAEGAMASKVDAAVSGLELVIAGNRQAAEAQAKEVRAACDTVDLWHQVRFLDAAKVEHAATLDAIQTDLAALGDKLDDTVGVVNQSLIEINAAVVNQKQLTARELTTLSEQVLAAGKAHAESIVSDARGLLAAELRAASGSLTAGLETVRQDVKELEKVIPQVRQERRRCPRGSRKNTGNKPAPSPRHWRLPWSRTAKTPRVLKCSCGSASTTSTSPGRVSSAESMLSRPATTPSSNASTVS